MTQQKRLFRYLYDENNDWGMKAYHDDKITNNEWPNYDIDHRGKKGWWIGVGKLEENFATSASYPNQDYNNPEFTSGVLKGGEEVVPPKYGTEFEENYNENYGFGVYLAGIIGSTL